MADPAGVFMDFLPGLSRVLDEEPAEELSVGLPGPSFCCANRCHKGRAMQGVFYVGGRGKLWRILPMDVRTWNFLPTNGFSV